MTITARRNRLATDAVEAVECMYWWIKDGITYHVDVSMEDELVEGNKRNEIGRKNEAEDIMIIDIKTEFG